MRACWLPPKFVSEMCCRWACGIPRILNAQYVFIALDDVDIAPNAIVRTRFGAFTNLSFSSQIGVGIDIRSTLLATPSESASIDSTFSTWQKGSDHLAEPELAEDAFLWTANAHSMHLLDAGGKRAQCTHAPTTFNFSTAVHVIGEEGHHGTLLLPGFASKDAIIAQVATKIRPRFSFIHPVSEALPLSEELLLQHGTRANGARNCVCLVSIRTVEHAAFILFNSVPMHIDAPHPETKSLRGVWLPNTNDSLQNIQRACDIPATFLGRSTVTFCDSEPVPDEGFIPVHTGNFIYYTAAETERPHAHDTILHVPDRGITTIPSGTKVSLIEYRDRLPSFASFQFTHSYIYFPIGDAWQAVTANFWLYAILISTHFSCNGTTALNADTIQSMLTFPEYCKLTACSHDLARFVRLRAPKDTYWCFEFRRVYENATGNLPFEDFSIFRIPHSSTVRSNLSAPFAMPARSSALDSLIWFYHPYYKHSYPGTLLNVHAGGKKDNPPDSTRMNLSTAVHIIGEEGFH